MEGKDSTNNEKTEFSDEVDDETRDEETGEAIETSTEVNAMRETPRDVASTPEVGYEHVIHDFLLASKKIGELLEKSGLISPMSSSVSPEEQLTDKTCSSDIDRVDGGSRTSQQTSENSGMNTSTDASVSSRFSRTAEAETNANSESSATRDSSSTSCSIDRLLADVFEFAEEISSSNVVVAESSSCIERSSSENSEITRINDARIGTSVREYFISDSNENTGNSIVSDICSKSPPQITSEPKIEAPGVFKIPPLKPDTAKTPKKSPNSSNRATSDSGNRGKNSTNLYPGEACLEFPSLCASSLTKLGLSLPNVNRPPRDPTTRGSGDFNIANRAKRALFTGNLNSDQPTSSGAAISNTSEGSRNSGYNRELNQNRNSERLSKNIPRCSSEFSKPKASRKLTYTTPDRETNANETLPEASWLEKFGDFSGLHSQEVLPTPDGSSRENKTTKRKMSTPDTPETKSPKKPRPSSVSNPQNIGERIELEQAGPYSMVEKAGPKRKAEDLQSSSNLEASFSDDSKEEKLTPQTPSDKTGASSSSLDSSDESSTEKAGRKRKAEDLQSSTNSETSFSDDSKELASLTPSDKSGVSSSSLDSSAESSTEKAGPKRKAEDLQNSSNSETSFSDDSKDELTSRTPSDATGVSSSSQDSSEESSTENEEK